MDEEHHKRRRRSHSPSERSPSRERSRERHRDRGERRDRSRERDRDRDWDRRPSRERSSSRHDDWARPEGGSRLEGGSHGRWEMEGSYAEAPGGYEHDNRGHYSEDRQIDRRQHDYQDSRRSRYRDHLEGGLEGSLHHREEESPDHYEPRQRRWETPNNILYVGGLPDDTEEKDIYRLFEGWQGLSTIRVMRDKATGQSRGFAFVEFASADVAQEVMEAQGGGVRLPGGRRLTLEYSQQAVGGQTHAAHSQDWVCPRCRATNFARRHECHQCSSVRPPDAERVPRREGALGEADPPSTTLRITNLDPFTTEEMLYAHFSAHAPVISARVVTERSGRPHAAYVEFSTVAEATATLHALQDSVMEGQQRKVRLQYARERSSARQQTSEAASNALEAAQAQAYYNWAPAEYDPDATQAAQPADDAATQNGQAAPESEFQYDSASGYMYHAASGYYYDANTGLYFDSATQQWKGYDEASGQYVAVGGEPAVSTAAEAAIASTQASIHSHQELHAPEAEYKPPPEARKRGAIIGSAAKLNPQGVLEAAREAAREARARELQLLKLEEAAAAKAAKKAKTSKKAAITRAPSVLGAPPTNPQPTNPPPATPYAAPPSQSTAQGGAPATSVKGVIRSSGKWGRK